MPSFIINVTCNNNGGFAKQGKIPWPIPQSVKDSTLITSSNDTVNVVIMGRKTWETLPPGGLVERINIVISKSLKIEKQKLYGATVVASLEDALVVVKACPFRIEKAFVIGGEGLFKEAIKCPEFNRVYVTFVEPTVVGTDRYFPIKQLKKHFVIKHVGETELCIWKYRSIEYERIY